MATLATNPAPITAASQSVSAAFPPIDFLRCVHSDALVVQFGFDAARLSTLSALGPFEAVSDADMGVMLLHSYTLSEVAIHSGDGGETWRNTPLRSERFAELSIPVTFRRRSARLRGREAGTPGRLILRQWTTARIQSLIAPRPYGIPVRSASIDLETVGESRILTIRQTPATGSSARTEQADPIPGLSVKIQTAGRISDCVSAAQKPNPWLFDRLHAFTVNGTTIRGHRSEFVDPGVVETSAKFIDGSLLCSVVAGIDSFRLIGAQRLTSPCTVNASLPICLNGPACAVEWNELK